jgi:hypothetical protein
VTARDPKSTYTVKPGFGHHSPRTQGSCSHTFLASSRRWWMYAYHSRTKEEWFENGSGLLPGLTRPSVISEGFPQLLWSANCQPLKPTHPLGLLPAFCILHSSWIPRSNIRGQVEPSSGTHKSTARPRRHLRGPIPVAVLGASRRTTVYNAILRNSSGYTASARHRQPTAARPNMETANMLIKPEPWNRGRPSHL